MKFYDRTEELEWLGQTRKTAFENHSQMTVVTGRRRIGKTKLILKSCEGTPTAYLFIDRSNEALLCNECARSASEALGVYISPEITSFAGLFETLMEIGRNLAYNLVIDEFQEFFYINPAVYSQIQDIWDRYKDSTHVNFIASGSVYSLMHRIFMNYKEPLYGRCDSTIRLKPFDTGVLKQILHDYKPDYTNDDLLALFTFTGGIPKYIESFMDNGCTDMISMVDWMMRPNSMFQNEGKSLLIQEFGRKYGNYFAILSAIAGGDNTLQKLSGLMGNTSINGHLKRLEEDYELISRKRPIFAKAGTQTVRFEISDLFLRFWFRYFIKYHYLIEVENFERLGDIIKDDYPTYSGLTLEMYFTRKLIESRKFSRIGSWWQSRQSDPCEVDIVAVYAEAQKAVVAEVKRQRKNFKPEDFNRKVETLRTKILTGYEIEQVCYTLDEM